MPETFFSYLREERGRLDCALDGARSADIPDVSTIACIQRQIRIVEDQMARWRADLSDTVTAA